MSESTPSHLKGLFSYSIQNQTVLRNRQGNDRSYETQTFNCLKKILNVSSLKFNLSNPSRSAPHADWNFEKALPTSFDNQSDSLPGLIRLAGPTRHELLLKAAFAGPN